MEQPETAPEHYNWIYTLLLKTESKLENAATEYMSDTEILTLLKIREHLLKIL